MYRFYRRVLAPAAVLAVAVASSFAAQGPRTPVPGEKVDSGLGALPHYRDWAKHAETRHLVARANAVPGEKLDSGLGELKPYPQWTHNAGRARQAVEIASRQ